MLKLATYNCQGAKHKIPRISEICNKCDILMLQETWIMPHETKIFGNTHAEFESFSLSSVDTKSTLVSGRPFGGVSILWRKTISHLCKLITFEDNRLLGMCLTIENYKILLINVYLPYQCNENHSEYIEYLAKLESIIESFDVNGVMLMGDFNADPKKEFFHELKRMCDAKDLIISDVSLLPPETYTHVNTGSLSRTWLDHCVASPTVHAAIADVKVDYTCNASDHMPMTVALNTNATPIMKNPSNDDKKLEIKWNFRDEIKVGQFFELIHHKMFDSKFQLCECKSYCEVQEHRDLINAAWSNFIKLVLNSGMMIFGSRRSKGPIVPGWSDYVEQLYEASREAFLLWRTEGSPKEGLYAANMRRKRAQFKHALRQCRAEAENVRAERLASRLQEGNVYSFWRELRSIQPRTNCLPTRVDGAMTDQEIVKLWETKYSSLLNSVDDERHQNKFEYMMSKSRVSTSENITMVSAGEIKSIVKDLKCGKAIGLDDIPNEFYKVAPKYVLDWISKIINNLIYHTYVPEQMMKILILPVIKNKMNDPSDSDNYRPIGIGTTMYKIVEKVIYNRIEQYLSTSDNQFGFKENLSTDLCIFSVKEVINYYRNLGTPIFLCFIDVKSAFDKVSHWKLLCKLIKRGIPNIMIRLLQYCFTSQVLYAGWGGLTSQAFKMTNGLRQGSVLSPKFYCIYSDSLNKKLNQSGIGCYIKGVAMNNFSYADDLVLICPCAAALNGLLSICDKYAKTNYTTYNTKKTECMLICSKDCKLVTPPDIILNNCTIKYVSKFKYLGHIISNTYTDDDDIIKELRNMYGRGNTIINQFKYMTLDVKVQLFKSFCYPIYGASQWSNYRAGSLRRLRVGYNAILRRLLGIRLWDPEEERLGSMSAIFVNTGVRTFPELIRSISYNCMERIQLSDNSLIQCLITSEAKAYSRQWSHWENLLVIP